MVLLEEIMDALGAVFPWPLAGSDPLSGLISGTASSEVNSVLCAVEITRDLLLAAAEDLCDLLVVHDPSMLSSSSPEAGSVASALLREAEAAGIGVIGCHTNAAVAQMGPAGLAARTLELRRARPIVPVSDVWLAKVVVFVPEEALESVFGAMADAGAGAIGEYSHASFRSRGTGTFLPGEGARPYSGRTGELSSVDETRLEMICPSFLVDDVIGAILDQHPYEEVAYDIYQTLTAVPWGYGRIGDLHGGMTVAQLEGRLSRWCSSDETARVGEPHGLLERIAVAPGCGDALVEPALDGGAQAFITGEIGPEARALVREAGISSVALGCHASLKAVAAEFARVLAKASDERGWGINVREHVERRGTWQKN